MATTGPRRRRSDARPPRTATLRTSAEAAGAADAAAAGRSIALALEAARRTRRPMTVVAVALPAGARAGALDEVASIVRYTVRDTDALWPDGGDGLILVLADADGPICEPALARLRMRLKREGFREVLMGRAAPAPGISAEVLLELVRSDMRPISQHRSPG